METTDNVEAIADAYEAEWQAFLEWREEREQLRVTVLQQAAMIRRLKQNERPRAAAPLLWLSFAMGVVAAALAWFVTGGILTWR